MVYKNIIVTIIVFIVIVSLLILFTSVRPLRYKTKLTPTSFGYEYQEVNFKTEDGITINAWFVPTNYSNATIIVGHGYPFDKTNVFPVLIFLNEHYNLLFIDHRYFGKSKGAYTTAGYKERLDILAAVEYIKSVKGLSKTKIGAIGFSLSGASILMAKSADIKAIVADSTYANIDKMIEQIYWIFPGITKIPFVLLTQVYARLFLGIDTKDVSPTEAIKDIKSPVLLIHGNKDSQIPVENSKLIYEASNKSRTELWIVKDADHGQAFATNPNEYKKKVLGFFDEHLLK